MIHWFEKPHHIIRYPLSKTKPYSPYDSLVYNHIIFSDTHYPKSTHIPNMIHWFEKTTSYYRIPIIQNQPYYDDIKYTILHHILSKLYCWLNGSVVFGQKGAFVSIGMDSLQTTRLYTNIQTNLILI